MGLILIASAPAAAFDVMPLLDPAAVPGLVKVLRNGNPCTGVVISSNTVLTTADGCACRADGTCDPEDLVEVEFRDDPNIPGQQVQRLRGDVFPHDNFSGFFLQDFAPHNLAIIKLRNGVSPAHAKPLPIASGYPELGTLSMLVGHFGCPGVTPWFYTWASVATYMLGHEIIGFAGWPDCGGSYGDSGEAILSQDGTLLFGIAGRRRCLLCDDDEDPRYTYGATTTADFHWIKSHMCLSTLGNLCDGNGPLCNCAVGTDILWRHADGQLAIWFMDGATVTAQAYPGIVGEQWQVEGFGNFDDHPDFDILWRHVNGQIAIWLMEDGVKVGELYPAVVPEEWQIQATADFDLDGYADILWRRDDGQLAIWFQGDPAQVAFPGYDNQLGPVDPAWEVLGVGYVNQDGLSDILWRHRDGQVTVWFMQGATFLGEGIHRPLSNDFALEAIGDFDRNGLADILWRNTVNGRFLIWFDGNAFAGAEGYPNYGNQAPSDFQLPGWHVQGAGDFDRDGRDDIVWRHDDGSLAIWLLDGIHFRGDLHPPGAPTAWKIETLFRPARLATNKRAVPEPAGRAASLAAIVAIALLYERRRKRP